MAENKKEAEIYFLEIEKIYHNQKLEGAWMIGCTAGQGEKPTHLSEFTLI